MTIQSITPCLWFNMAAEEAAEFYVSVFENSSITSVSRYGEGAPVPPGTALLVEFTLDGTRFQALNGGPRYSFTEAVSFVVNPDTQSEVDRLWEGLTHAGGEPGQCGWLKDRFGVSWQIVPSGLFDLMSDPDPAASARVMGAFQMMGKIDLAVLVAARDATP